jgi:predicted ribosomally synthesized peptide with nif11-like leader
MVISFPMSTLALLGERIKADTVLQENLRNAKDSQDFIEIARASGIELSADDVEELENRIKRLSQDNAQVEELGDDDLEGVTGGTGPIAAGAAAVVGGWLGTKALDAGWNAIFD